MHENTHAERHLVDPREREQEMGSVTCAFSSGENTEDTDRAPEPYLSAKAFIKFPKSRYRLFRSNEAP